MLTGYQRPSPYSDCTDEDRDDDYENFVNNVNEENDNGDDDDYGDVYSDWKPTNQRPSPYSDCTDEEHGGMAMTILAIMVITITMTKT